MLLATFAPLRTLAADPTDQGKITIEVSDPNGKALIGDWYLHQGSTDLGFVVRNGSKGEVFNASAGTYFLEVRNLKAYPFRKVLTANPQTLEIGGTLRFGVRYFVTEEQMANATSDPVVETPVTVEPAPVVVVPAPDLAPEAVTPAPASKPKLVNNHIKLNIVRTPETDPWIEEEQPAEDREYSLAVTGPEGLLGVLSILSMVSGLWIVKRKNA